LPIDRNAGCDVILFADRDRDFLYRESDEGLYVLGDRQPPVSPIWHHQSRALPEFRVGDRLRFTLHANPVIRRKRDDGKTVKLDPIMDRLHGVPSGERASVRMQIAQDVTTEWLTRLGAGGGYELQSSVLESYRQRRINRRGGKPVQFGAVDVSGELVVTDADAFAHRLRQGFGSSRAWGCGLMLCRRV
jgi:CRISPR system Cascade subunit CasE